MRGGWWVVGGGRWASYNETGLVRKEMKLDSCLGVVFSADAMGGLVVSSARKAAGKAVLWFGWAGQGEGGAGGMDCAVSELRARNGRGWIPQSGGGRTVSYVLLQVVGGLSMPCLSRCMSLSLSLARP